MREYLTLLVETGELDLQQKAQNWFKTFVIRDPELKSNQFQRPNFTLHREFTLKKPGQAPQTGMHDVDVYLDVHFRRSKFKGSHTQPPDEDEFEINDWSVEAVDGYDLSVTDARRLQSFLGDLTEDEEAEAYEMKKNEEPDFDPDFD